MMRFSKGLHALLLGPLLTAGCTTFPDEPLVQIILRGVEQWPDSMRVGDLHVLELEIVDGADRVVSGVNVQWATDSPCCLRLPDTSSSRATLLATGVSNQSTVKVTVTGPGLEAVEDSVTIRITRIWPAGFTVTQVDTVSLNIDPRAEPVTVSWESSDTGILRVVAVPPHAVELTALRAGPVELRPSITGSNNVTEQFAVPVFVDRLEIQPAGSWPDTIRTTATHSVSVVISNIDSTFAAEVVSWRSSNGAVFGVTAENGLEAEITGRGLGTAELIAGVELAGGFERSEVRQVVVVAQGWSAVSTGGWFAGQVGTGGGDRYFGHTCAISSGEEVYCWGSGWFGQLGVGSQGIDVRLLVPTRIPSLFKFQQVSAGGAHTCALSNPPGTTGAGQVFCWGSNASGEVDASSTSGVVPFPVQASVDQVSELSVGVEYSCATENRLIQGARAPNLMCWGALTASPPEYVVSRDLTTGVHLACVANGCEGWNWAGQGGVPPEVFGPECFYDGSGARCGLSQGAAGADHSCSFGTATLWCNGSNEYGQLGAPSAGTCDLLVLVGLGAGDPTIGGGMSGVHNGLYPVSALYTGQFSVSGASPVNLPCGATGPVDGPAFASVTAGFGFTCALTAIGEAYCWGRNTSGQLGNGLVGGNELAPVRVAGGLRFSSIEAGLFHTCGVTIDKAIYCWGSNNDGQLGNGNTGVEATPVLVIEPLIGG